MFRDYELVYLFYPIFNEWPPRNFLFASPGATLNCVPTLSKPPSLKVGLVSWPLKP